MIFSMIRVVVVLCWCSVVRMGWIFIMCFGFLLCFELDGGGDLYGV